MSGGSYALGALGIGMGLRPNLTGKGNGLVYARAVVDDASVTYTPQRLRVTIMHFNTRARRVWEKRGFVLDSTFVTENGMCFVILLREL